MFRRCFLAAGLLGAGGCGRRSEMPVLHAAERARAIRRGMEFIYQTALNPKDFAEFGQDYLWCFYGNSVVSTDAGFSAMCRQMGQERAKAWRKEHPRLPAGASVNTLIHYAYASMTADLLGVKDELLKYQIRQAAPRFSARDFLGFDPLRDSIPTDVPKRCTKCGQKSPRGVTQCPKCGRTLEMTPPIDIFFDALITSYSGNMYGMRFGADYADVIQRLPAFHPYPAPTGLNDDFYSVAYTVTHIVYTMNDYDMYQLRPEWLPHEYDYLRAHYRAVLNSKDPETLGEFIDSLKAFGLTDNDPMIREGIEFLLGSQNPDGSWGDPKSDDVYIRYHTTWTGVGGLLDYAWHGVGVRFPEALLRLKQAPTWRA